MLGKELHLHFCKVLEAAKVTWGWGSADRWPGSGWRWTVEKVILLVTSCTVSKAHAPQTQQSVIWNFKKYGICRPSVGRIIHVLFRASHPPRGKQCACSIDNVFWSSV